MASFGVSKARLGPAESNPQLDDLIFPLNPNKIIRSTAPVYAESNVAQADFGRYNPFGGPRSNHWVRNRAEEIRIEFLLVPRDRNGNVLNSDNDDVEDHLVLLDRFMQRGQDGEPPDLIFSMGVRHDRVRIIAKEVDERIFCPDLRVRQASVHLTLRTVT